jgi:putative membrane protein
MKIAAWIGLALGGVLAIALIAHYGLAGILDALRAVGWTGFAIVIAVHLALLAAMGLAWFSLARAAPGVRPTLFVWGRLVRDSASELLPLSQVGGYVLGTWAVALGGVPLAIAAATTIADVTTEVVAQLFYTAGGLALLDRLHPDNGFARPVLIGLAVMAVLVLVFIAVQRRNFRMPARLASRLSERWLAAFGGLASAAEELRAIHHHRRGTLVACTVVHLATWIGSGLEVWLALRFMGVPLSPAAALALESLLYGARSVAFLVPNAVGVQEGVYVALGAVLGLGPEAALALSLLKRGRDLAIGAPVLLAWQAIESRRALRRARGVTAR